jgi:Tol biopolymer transport system component/predicted Ser/Thr protein kinase
MPLTPGTRLGPYEILTPLGAGGMGEVYKARDTRLDRTVAIKLSKENFSERFEREARAIAALNHPNICQLYDVGPNYLVMEYVEGSPVAPPDSNRKLLDIAVQIADGLAAAHTAGIVHRDLKPDNILIARDGRVRILDFGLAKITAASDNDKTALTDAGTTIGTIAYMSPEQARGNPDLTPQSDQFSFGLILYELASGKRPFQRDSAVEIMTAIIREDADPLTATLPAQFRWIVERLMAKDPADRYDSTRDLYRDLRQLRDRLSESTSVSGIQAASTTAPMIPIKRSRVGVLPAAIVAVIVAIAAIAGWMLHPAAGTARYKFTPIEVVWENPSLAIWSPDGNAFAYAAGAAGDRRVFVRYLNSPTPKPLTRSARDWYPAGWSPDSKRVIVRGANPQGEKPPYALFAVPVFGGEPDLIMTLDSLYVSISPDGKALAAIGEPDNKLTVYTASPVGSPLQRYTPAPFERSDVSNAPNVQFSKDNRSLMLVEDVTGGRQVWLLPYPAGQGTPRRTLTSLPNTGNTPRWSWFPGGRTGILSMTTTGGTHLWFTGLRSGPRQPLMAGTPSETENQPALSPDGKKLLFTQGGTEYTLASASLSDATVTRLISTTGMTTGMPAWARHQDKLVYDTARSGSSAIWMRSEGWDRPIVTADAFPPGTTDKFMTPTLSPDGDRLVYTRSDKDQIFQNWISSVSGGPPVRLTNAMDTIERGGSWSPDGAQIVYWQFKGGKTAIMLAKTTGEAVPVMLRERVGNPLPEWSPDGQWISFLDSASGGGWVIISPEGKTLRTYGEPKAVQMTFSADSKRLYGIRVENRGNTLFSIDLATKEVKNIGDVGKDFTPASYSNPGIRLSLSPDGKSVLFPSMRRSNSLWMLEGFDPPGYLDRLREMVPW